MPIEGNLKTWWGETFQLSDGGVLKENERIRRNLYRKPKRDVLCKEGLYKASDR